MEEKRVEIFRGDSGEVIFNVDPEGETIWATQEQMARVFDTDLSVISRHLKNIYAEGELEESPAFSETEIVGEERTIAKNARVQNRTVKEKLMVRKEGNRVVRRKVKVYNLDAIISVGYRVNSKKATQFRVWATGVLRQYLIGGVAVNERRLISLQEKKDLKRLRDVEGMMGIVRRLTTQYTLNLGEANGVIEVISRYAGSFRTLEEYDDGHIDLSFMGSAGKQRILTKEACFSAVQQLRESVGGSELFGKLRNGSFEGSLAAIFQSFDGRELYPSVPEKAANLLYFIIKDHPFFDGNKRIGALLFILFLTLNDYHLTEKGETKISDRALTAIALLIAESEPGEKKLIISLVCRLLE
ncbi:type II toxin-antitoxin system death-on-curing family toxin [Candidatus Saccharibacteria bacterium]|nr:type II toxin-antitoxin system death-on-curing family toxin [Candidatus Saccharibacteria bacterium]